MGSWTHIHLEAFCMFNSMSQKKWTCFELETDKKSVHENKDYIPKTKRPKWCVAKNKKKFPQAKCLESACPFFAYWNCPKKDYILFDKIFDKQEEKPKKKKIKK